MPTYDYRCTVCGHQFEAFQSITAQPLEDCPECGKKIERLIGGGLGVIFKGSGYYCTDNKKSSATSAPAKSAESSTKPATEPSTEKKPAKTETKTPVSEKAAS